MLVINSLNKQVRELLGNGVIEVRGKAMNRTALGVVDAMFQLFPKATFADMKQMLPDIINPSAPKNYKSLFNPYNPDRLYGVIQPASIISECEGTDININHSHFTEPQERFTTSDGVEILVSRTWESSDTATGESDIQNLINHVKQYGVRVVQLEKKENFNKGEYHLEVINPQLYAILIDGRKEESVIDGTKEESKPWWIWLLAVLFVLLAAFFGFKSCKEEKPKEVSAPVVEQVQAPVAVAEPLTAFDSISKEIEQGEKVDGRKVTFHNIAFEKGKSILLASSDSVLLQVSDFLSRFPNLKMEIIGYSSDEGSSDFNKKLSESRAKAVYEMLMKDSVDASRLTFKGMGSANPLVKGSSDSARALNRRTEFVIQQQL
jgi:outer membrane protein OmpA-like peptidoglycan-associated protein